MKSRQTLRNGALALAGLGVAVGVGMAANAVSQDSIGLSAQKLEASRSLAPAEARRPSRAERRDRRRRATRRVAAHAPAGTGATPTAEVPRCGDE